MSSHYRYMTQSHATERKVTTSIASASLDVCVCPAAPVATTSNGEPPPESELESWLLPADVPVLVGAAVGSLNWNIVDVACVAVVSIAIPPDEDGAVEDCAELGGGLAVVVACSELLVLVLVCSVDFAVSVLAVVVELAPLVVVDCSLLGHSAATPNPFWKTPMMLVSPTSTSLHPVFTLTPIRTRPARHWTLHVAAAAKSEAAQPSMGVV